MILFAFRFVQLFCIGLVAGLVTGFQSLRASSTVDYNQTGTFFFNHEISPKISNDFKFLSRNYRTHSTGCSKDKLKNMTGYFFHTLRRETQCPQEEWLLDFSYSSYRMRRKQLFINIGSNKGYNFASWMNVFAPSTGVTPRLWHSILSDVGVGDCGPCKNCEDVFNVSPESSYSLDPSNVVIVGVDINPRNIRLMEEAIDYGRSANKFKYLGLTLIVVHGAGSNKTGLELKARDCPDGFEGCHLFAAGNKDGVDVKAVTVDEVVHGLIEEGLLTSNTESPVVTNLMQFSKAFENSKDFYNRRNRSPDQQQQPESVLPPAASAASSSSLSGSQPQTQRRLLRGENNRGHSSQDDTAIVDILQIDTEGHDPAVLQGAFALIRRRSIRCLVFEYHYLGLWKTTVKLQDVVSSLDLYDFDCYFQGKRRLWPITGKRNTF